MAVRFGVERGTDEQIERAAALIERLAEPGIDLEPDEVNRIQVEFSRTLVEASGNLALSLVRRGVALQFMDRVCGKGLLGSAPSENRERFATVFAELAGRIRRRDAAGSAAMYFDGMQEVHARIVEALRDAAEERRVETAPRTSTAQRGLR
jgi:DNA-binding GntR family transcriptional regulator